MDPEEMAILIGATMVFIVPLVAILTYHQRKMTELIHRKPDKPTLPDNLEVTHELRQIKEALQAQAIAFDNLAGELRRSKAPSELTRRLEEETSVGT